MKTYSKLIFIYLITLLITGCNTAVLKYQLDPGIDNMDSIPKNLSIVAMKVIDSRDKTIKNNDNSKQLVVAYSDNEAKLLQDKLVALLKQEGYKIISNPLLADVAFELKIMRLDLTVESATFKSVIEGHNELKFTAIKRGEQWSKIYRGSRKQEVANPTNNLDVTGVMNQMLTKQLSNMFSDQALKKFISK